MTLILTDMIPFNSSNFWKYNIKYLQWRTKRGGLGCSNPPPKFRSNRRSPRSHEQEKPASQFSFEVHCVLIWL